MTCKGYEYADPPPEEAANGEVRIEMCRAFPFLFTLVEARDICRGKYWRKQEGDDGR